MTFCLTRASCWSSRTVYGCRSRQGECRHGCGCHCRGTACCRRSSGGTFCSWGRSWRTTGGGRCGWTVYGCGHGCGSNGRRHNLQRIKLHRIFIRLQPFLLHLCRICWRCLKTAGDVQKLIGGDRLVVGSEHHQRRLFPKVALWKLGFTVVQCTAKGRVTSSIHQDLLAII